jgi:Putative nucleotidyltransferase DUF294
MGAPDLGILRKHVNAKAYTVFRNATSFCRGLIKQASRVSDACLAEHGVPARNVCVVAVGSLGRFEALQASDIDLIPVLADKEMIPGFEECDQALRRQLRDTLKINVSKGELLTKADAVSEFSAPTLIGGDSDEVKHLTKRILILTESVPIGGS